MSDPVATGLPAPSDLTAMVFAVPVHFEYSPVGGAGYISSIGNLFEKQMEDVYKEYVEDAKTELFVVTREYINEFKTAFSSH